MMWAAYAKSGMRELTMNDWTDAEHLVEQAHAAYEAGKWDEAATALREALALNPYRPEWHFNLGLTLEQAGRFAEAAGAFAACSELDDEDPQVFMATGVNLLRADEPERAIEWLTRSERADPSSAASWVHRIEAYTRLGDHEQAELMFYMAQQVNANDAGAYANMAESLLARGLNERAIWCLREAAQLDPDMPRIHARLGEAYARVGKRERARVLFLRELRADPGDVNTLLDLGQLLCEMGKLVEAGEKFRRVLEIESDNSEARLSLGALAEREGRVNAAIDLYRSVMRCSPDLPDVRRRLASLLLVRSDALDREEAIELLEAEAARVLEPGALEGAGKPAPAGGVDDSQSDRELGAALLDAGLFERAKRVLAQRVKRCGVEAAGGASEVGAEAAENWHLLALAHYGLGEPKAGVRCGRRCVKIDIAHSRAVRNMIIAHARLGEWTRAGYWLREAKRMQARQPDLARLRLRVALLGVVSRLARACGVRR